MNHQQQFLLAPYLVNRQKNEEESFLAPLETLVGTAIRHNLAPLVLWALKQRADTLDPALAAQLAPLQAQARQVAARYVHLKTARAHVDATLASAGIPALWLKGAALAETVYPQPVLRPMGDLDVLVPFARRAEALAALKAAGYADEPRDPLGAQVAAFLPPDETHHHYNLVGGPGGGVRVELHFRVARAILPDLAALDWFWSQAMEATDRQGKPLGFSTLRPAAHLLYLCAHALLQHGEGQIGLLHFYDLHLLATVYDLDWALIVERAAILRWTYPVERALALAQGVFRHARPRLGAGAVAGAPSRRRGREHRRADRRGRYALGADGARAAPPDAAPAGRAGVADRLPAARLPAHALPGAARCAAAALLSVPLVGSGVAAGEGKPCPPPPPPRGGPPPPPPPPPSGFGRSAPRSLPFPSEGRGGG
ncbi:MAG: nucleotidyltransferase family protein [Anaerolineae bacterium]|nr:nucleotidyltransferase family protein [Anaerolineae bacterium]